MSELPQNPFSTVARPDRSRVWGGLRAGGESCGGRSEQTEWGERDRVFIGNQREQLQKEPAQGEQTEWASQHPKQGYFWLATMLIPAHPCAQVDADPCNPELRAL